ncbi:MAG: type II toxin-antitoxin system HicA family toxin [Candidatus Staskawiczbacteria bacterium]|nr:type II toxin-antitoxin system HicA family toxin [Candidatus Staskawiczbacteria bacterium]
MSRVPRISTRDALRVFLKIGYSKTRQRGSHIRLHHTDYPNHKPITLPNHRTIKIGLLQRCIKDSGTSIEEFIKLL